MPNRFLSFHLLLCYVLYISCVTGWTHTSQQIPWHFQDNAFTTTALWLIIICQTAIMTFSKHCTYYNRSVTDEHCRTVSDYISFQLSPKWSGQIIDSTASNAMYSFWMFGHALKNRHVQFELRDSNRIIPMKLRVHWNIIFWTEMVRVNNLYSISSILFELHVLRDTCSIYGLLVVLRFWSSVQSTLAQFLAGNGHASPTCR